MARTPMRRGVPCAIAFALVCTLSLGVHGAGRLDVTIDGAPAALSLAVHRVSVDIRDRIAQTVVEETFCNHTGRTLEGTLYFPVPAGATISGFTLWVDGAPVEADVVEKERGREIFETIVSQQRDPALLEWTGGSVFKARIFPILGFEERRIRVSYLEVLRKSGGFQRYAYLVGDGERARQPVEEFAFVACVTSTPELREVTCSHSAVRLEKSDHSALLRLPPGTAPPDRDIEIRIAAASPEAGGFAVTHVAGDEGYFMVLADPLIPAPAAPRLPSPIDLLCVADTSASLDGERARALREVLARLLDRCTEADSFNVLAFDAARGWAFPEAVPATPGNRAQALAFLEGRGALGWTDLPAAFREAAERLKEATQVVFLGDGVPTAGEAQSAAAAAAIRTAWPGKGRVHAVAIGGACDMIVLEALASLGGGSLHRMRSGTDAAAVAEAVHAAMAGPAAPDMRLAWQGVEVADVYPAHLHAFPPGEELVITGRYRPGREAREGFIEIAATVNGVPVTRRIPLSLAERSSANDYLPCVWAGTRLEDLRGREDRDGVRDDIIALSEKYHVITPYTSFLVLESADDRRRFNVTRRTPPARAGDHEARARAAMRDALQRRDDLRAKILRLYGSIEDVVEPYAIANAVEMQSGAAVAALANAFFVFSGGRHEGEPAAFTTWRGARRDGTESSPLLGRYSLKFGESSFVPGYFYRDPSSDPDHDPDALLDDSQAAGLDTPGTLESRDEGADAGSPMDYPTPPMSAGRSVISDSLGPYESLRNPAPFALPTPLDFVYPCASHELLSDDHSGVRYGAYLRTNDVWWPSYRLGGLLPRILAPPRSLPAMWPPEITGVIEALDHRSAIARLEGGLRLRLSREIFDRSGASCPAGSSTLLLSRESWHATELPAGSDLRTDAWCDAEERGMCLARLLGTRRKSERGEAHVFPSPFQHYFGLLHGREEFREGVPSLAIEGSRAVLSLSFLPRYDRGTSAAIAFDLERSCITRIAWFSGDEEVRTESFSGFVRAGGAYWPAAIERRERGALTERVRVDCEELTRDAHGAAAGEFRAALDDAVLFAFPLPSVAEAAERCRAGKGSWDDHWALIDRFVGRDAGDAVWSQWTEAEKLVRGKWGLEWLRLFVLALLGRDEEVRRCELRLAHDLAARAPPEGPALAQALCAQQLVEPDSEDPRLSTDMFVSWGSASWDAYGHDPHEAALRAILAPLMAQIGASPRRALAGIVLDGDSARELIGRDGIDAAVAHIERTAETRTSDSRAREDILSRGAQVLLESGHGRAFLALVEKRSLHASEQAGAELLTGYLSALAWSGREDEADKLARSWIAIDAAQDSSECGRARTEAALGYTLAFGGSPSPNVCYVARRFVAPLYDLARAASLQMGGRWIAERILEHDNNERMPETRALEAWMYERLQEGIESLPPAVLANLFALTADCRPSPRQPSRSQLHARLLARWNGETDPVARGLLDRLIVSLADADTVLSLRRRQLAAAEDPQVRMRLRGEVCHLLLSSPWSRDAQEELLALIPQLGAGLDRFAIQADAVHSLAWYLTKGRALDALMERPDRFSKPRAELAALVRAARAEKRKEAIDALAALEEAGIGAALAPFVRIERLTLEAIARTDVQKTAADLHALLEMLPETPERPDLALRYRLAADRCLLALGCLATGPRADAQVAARLHALLRERAARDDGLIDAKLHLFRFLLAAGRIEELRAQLAAWCRELPPAEGDRWRPALADFHAAQGAFGEAIRVLLPLAERHGMQSHHYEALAAWHGILGDEAASRAACMRCLDESSDFALESLLEWNLRNLEATGRIDVEAARDVFVVLAGNRIRDPEPWSDFVFDRPVFQTEYFRETGDIRFLELAIAQHRPRSWQAIEGYGGLLWDVLEPVEDLATLRELSAAADRARASAAGAVDLCAADILDIVLARKAASLEGETDSFVARGAAALRGLGRVKGNLEGVPAVAGFLASLGGEARLHGPLEQEQLALLGELHERAPAGSEARLALAEQYAGALWDAGRHIDAIDVLQEFPVVPEDFPARMASSPDAAAVKRAEALLREKLERAKTVEDRLSCTQRLARFYAAAIGPENRVRLAAPAELYARAYRHSVAALRTAADTRWERFWRDRAFGPKAVFDLLERAQVLQLPAVREDARDFYLNVLPSFLGRNPYGFSDTYALGSYGEKTLSILGLKRFVETLADGAVRPPAEGGRRFRSALSALAARRPSDVRRILQEDAALSARVLALALADMRSDLETGFGDSRELPERYGDNPSRWMDEFPWLNVFGAGQAAAFLEVVTRFREEYADSPGAVIDAARVLALGLEREEEAASLLLFLEEKGGLDAEGRGFLARVLLQQNEPRRAMPLLEACIRHDPGALGFHLLLIEACRKAREDERAAAAAQAAGADLRNAGNWDGEVAHKLAAACLDNELPAPAAAYARDAALMLRGVDRKKASYLLVSAYETLIKAHAAQGDLMKAAEAAGEGFTVLRRSPRDREDLARLLEMVLVARRTEAASPGERGAAPLAPSRAGDRDLESYVHMGERFAEAGDEDAAERAYTTLVELSALESEGHALLAKVREEQGRWDEARRHWRRVAEIRPYEPAGPLGEARCLIRMGSANEARALLERITGRRWPDRFDDAKEEARELLDEIKAQKGAEASAGTDL